MSACPASGPASSPPVSDGKRLGETASVVLDTNVFVSATLFEGSLAQKLLERLLAQNIRIYSSQAILLEYERIVRRDFIYKRGLAALEVRLPYLLARIRALTIQVRPVQKVAAARDESDNRILECALAASSQYLVSYDSDLLCLRQFGRTRIIHPKEMLAILGKS